MPALLNPAYLYVGSDKWSSVTGWTTLMAPAAGSLVRQSAPTDANARVFVAVVGGVAAVAEPAWTVTKGAKTTDGTVTWQECTGQPAVNGDVTNTLAWTASAKSNTVALGQIIKRDSAASYQICTTAGTCGGGAEPAFSNTAGTTTADNTVTWTSLGVVGGFGAFTAPHKTINNADGATWSTVAGSTYYLSNGHAETKATALTLGGGQGTLAAPTKILCVSNATAPPTTTTTGATVSQTGGAAINFINGFCRWNGITFQVGSGALSGANFNINTASAANQTNGFENCTFSIVSTSATNAVNIGQIGAELGNVSDFKDCSFLFAATGQKINYKSGGPLNITGGSIAATGSIPTTVMTLNANTGGNINIRGCNLSTINTTLFDGTSSGAFNIVLANCRLHASLTTVTGPLLGILGTTIRVHNCSSTTNNYNMANTLYNGTITQDTTTVGAATDGTTGISWKVVTNANPTFYSPLQCEEIALWNNTTGGSKTATVEIAGAGTLTDNDLFVEVEYLGSASYPISSTVTSRPSPAAAATNLTTSTASWTGSPAVKQKIAVSFTPQMKGVVKVRVYVAKASTTVYIDPLVTVA